jgi:hypothetical protein
MRVRLRLRTSTNATRVLRNKCNTPAGAPCWLSMPANFVTLRLQVAR